MEKIMQTMHTRECSINALQFVGIISCECSKICPKLYERSSNFNILQSTKRINLRVMRFQFPDSKA